MAEMSLDEFAQQVWATANSAQKIAMANSQLIALLMKNSSVASPELNEALLAALHGMRGSSVDSNGATWVFDLAISAIDQTHPAPSEPTARPAEPRIRLVHDSEKD